MARVPAHEWTEIGKADQSRDVSKGQIELPTAKAEEVDCQVLIARSCAKEGRGIQLKVGDGSPLAPLLAKGDYKRLGLESNKPEVEVRPLTTGEKRIRTIRRLAFPVLALITAIAAAVTLFVPGAEETTLAITVAAGVLTALAGVWRAAFSG